MTSKIKSEPREKMSNRSFKGMSFFFKIIDFVFPFIDKRIKKFNIKESSTIVDYGCGPGRYAIRFAKLVGPKGKVYAVDIHELAIEKVYEKISQYNLKNIEPVLSQGYDDGNYDCGLPEKIADIVCALDMFFVIKDPDEFLTEISRILQDDGIFILDDGHQSRQNTKEKLKTSGIFKIIDENKDHIKLIKQ